jgi:fosfomycin resistance protein FosX
MTIQGISHNTFIVRDLEKASNFFKNIFAAKEVYSSGEETYSSSREKFLTIGEIWIAIMQGEPPQERSYNHMAFKIEESDFDIYLDKVRSAGVDLKESRPRVKGEGRSIYFYDFDNHLFELHTGSLELRLRRYAKGKV